MAHIAKNDYELHDVININDKNTYDATGNEEVDTSTMEKNLETKSARNDENYLIKGDDFTNSQCYINRWRRSAVIVSVISVVVTLSIAIIEFVVAKKEHSAAAFGLAFSSLLDTFSSIVVLWRYFRAFDTFSDKREHVSCTVLGSLFIISSIGISIRAILDLLAGDAPDMSDQGLLTLLVTSIVSSVVLFALFVAKVVIAKKLDSWTVFTDALNSLAGAVVALSMVVTTKVTKYDRYLWFLDSTVGLIVALFLLIYGLWLLTKHIPQLYSSTSYETK